MKNRTHRYQALVALVFSALVFSTTAYANDRFDRLVVFGDSLSDPGNAFVVLHEVSVPPYDLIPSAPYAIGGHHFSNGETWIEQYAKDVNLENTVGPALRAPGKFTNYATGAGRARPGDPFDLSSQVLSFLAGHSGTASADSLYVVYIGANDARDAIAALATDPSGASSTDIIGDAIEAITNNILILTSAGAREFLVPNVPNLALTPAIRLESPPVQAAAQSMSVAFNDALANTLAQLETHFPITIHKLDVYAILNDAVAHPDAYGFTEVAAPCITPGTTADPVCDQPDQFLFWDGIHPTRAGHAVLADQVEEVLPDHHHALRHHHFRK
ncbi:MAG: SGNH/GDSL hydrolase family protein [Gammaproteobacteria bacterium]|nr:SGNH/GDSL hydrolase family protein [Gammaproteobacteria bacterium]